MPGFHRDQMDRKETPASHSPEVDPFVVPELSVAHVAVVSYDLTDMLRRHIFLLGVNEAKLSLLAVTFRLQLLPLAGYGNKCVVIMCRATVNYTAGDNIYKTIPNIDRNSGVILCQNNRSFGSFPHRLIIG